MVGRPLPIDDLGQQELLESVAVLKHTLRPQTRLERRYVVSMSHAHFVERVAILSHRVLDDDITVDEVGAYPRGVKGCLGTIQEYHADDVVTNVTFLVHLEGRNSANKMTRSSTKLKRKTCFNQQ